MHCKNCGKYIDDKSKFCEYCGSKTESEKIKLKKIILSVLCVIVIIVLAYYSRALFVNAAFDSQNINSFSFDLNDDYIDVNITDGYLNTNTLKFVDLNAELCICDDESSFEEMGNHHSFNGEIIDVKESGIRIYDPLVNYTEKADDAEYSGTLIEMNNIDFENGKKYKCFLILSVRPKLPKNQYLHNAINHLDNALDVHGLFDYYELYFIYENGEFIKVNQ